MLCSRRALPQISRSSARATTLSHHSTLVLSFPARGVKAARCMMQFLDALFSSGPFTDFQIECTSNNSLSPLNVGSFLSRKGSESGEVHDAIPGCFVLVGPL